jgi:hemerythrin superfamily protein
LKVWKTARSKNRFKQLKKELDTHARIEETVFYPEMEEHEELREIVLESYEEHKQIKTLLREMDRSSGEKFKAKLKVLRENVEHHAEEDEEGKLFPEVRKTVDKATLEQLGEELQTAKKNRRRSKRRRAA